MASETPEATPIQQHVEESLPFSGLDQPEFVPLLLGPRVSSIKEDPKKYYGPVTIRNYLTGHTKKALRLSRAKDAPESTVFLKLPVELKLQVLEHLHPLDLYHFSLVSKSFRKFIIHSKALGVWKAAFTQRPDLPTPPPRVKESDWAFMIYGPGICCVCGKYGALTDFNFLKRFCGLCFKDHCLPVNAFRDESNSDIPSQHDIWTLIPKSYRFNGIRYNTYINTERFLKIDFSSMWKKLTLIRILVANGVPLVSDLYEEYKTALQDYVQRHHDSATNATDWALDVFRQISIEHDSIIFQLTEKCKSRLQTLGHDAQDIATVTNSIRCVFREQAICRLTCRTFRQIKPRIETLVRDVKANRIEAERRKLLKGIYQDYLKARPPDEWQYLPGVDCRRIFEIEGFDEFLEAPFDKRGDIAPGHAAAFFPEFIDSWMKEHQESIVEILPDLEDAEETFEAKVQRLELATSVMTCKDCHESSHLGLVLVGWKSICRHLCSTFNGYPDCTTYEVNHHAVAAAASLVSCVGLDPLATTVDDMNHRDDRFMCGNCMPEDHRGRRFMRVYTWLECLEHTMKMVNLTTDGIDPMHAAPAWILLSSAATRFVREHDKPHPHPLHHIWRCNHCAQHFENRVPQADAIDHVNRVHCIKNHVIGTDVVADLRKRIRKRRPFRLIRDPAFEHRCKHCSNLPIYKLWEKDALMKHLMKKHHINDPLENIDWETEVMIAASAALAPTPGTAHFYT